MTFRLYIFILLDLISNSWASVLFYRTPLLEVVEGFNGHSQDYIANYDDLKFTEPDPTPIGTNYFGLNYSNFFVDGTYTDYENLIKPASLPHIAMSYSSTMMRTIATARHYTFFDLHSMYLACGSGFPQNDCHITIIGSKVDGSVPVIKSVVYLALQNPTPFAMVKYEFDHAWTGLKQIEFSKVEIDGKCNYTGLLVDDLSYTLKRYK